MNNFNGVGPNFGGINRKNLYSDKSKNLEPKEAAKEALNADLAKEVQHKKPERMLDSMHQLGMLNAITPKKAAALKNNPQMKARIGEFMNSFEAEVEKSLKMFNKEFPNMPEAVARQVAAESVLKASDL